MPIKHVVNFSSQNCSTKGHKQWKLKWISNNALPCKGIFWAEHRLYSTMNALLESEREKKILNEKKNGPSHHKTFWLNYLIKCGLQTKANSAFHCIKLNWSFNYGIHGPFCWPL